MGEFDIPLEDSFQEGKVHQGDRGSVVRMHLLGSFRLFLAPHLSFFPQRQYRELSTQ